MLKNGFHDSPPGGVPSEVSDLRPDQYYSAFGYYIFRDLISHKAIDEFLAVYEKEIRPSDFPFLRQNTNREPHNLNEHQLVVNTLLNIHSFDLDENSESKQFSEFSELCRQLICSNAVSEALSSLTRYREHILVQSMYFEFKHTGTTADGRIEGHFTATGSVPTFIEEIQTRGIPLTEGLFAPTQPV